MNESCVKRVSVIIPVYNAEKYIGDCLDSILASDMDGVEVIAVNDGSTDHSLDVLMSYHEKHGVFVLSQSNGGAAKARNLGLAHATGAYVGFVDADDWVEPDMYRRMYESAELNDADIVFCNLYRNQSEKMPKYLPDGVYDRELMTKEIYPILISNEDENSGKVTLRGSVCLRLFSRKLIEDNHIRFCEGLIYNEDGMFCIQATLCAQKYLYMGSDYLYHNRTVGGSVTRRYIEHLWDKQQRLFPLLSEITDNFPVDFTSQVNKKVFEVGIYCVENECKQGGTVRNIKTIINSDVVQNAIRLVDYRKLKKINRGYYIAFWLKSAVLAQMVALYRNRKHEGRK